MLGQWGMFGQGGLALTDRPRFSPIMALRGTEENTALFHAGSQPCGNWLQASCIYQYYWGGG